MMMQSAFISAAVAIITAAAIVAFAPRCPADYPAIMSGDYINLGGCR